MQRNAKDEGEGFCEVGAAESEAHQASVLDAFGREVVQQRGEGDEEEGLQEGVRADLAERKFALAGDDKQRDSEITEGVFIEQEVDVRSRGLEGGAQADDGVGEGDDGEHLQQKDDEVDPVVGAHLGGEGAAKEEVAEREEGRVHGVPISVDDAGPLVRTEVVADVHIGDGVAVDLEAVVERVAEGDERDEDQVDGEGATEDDGDGGGLGGGATRDWIRLGGGHLGGCFHGVDYRRGWVGVPVSAVGTARLWSILRRQRLAQSVRVFLVRRSRGTQ